VELGAQAPAGARKFQPAAFILGWSSDGGGSRLKFFKMILCWHGTTA